MTMNRFRTTGLPASIRGTLPTHLDASTTPSSHRPRLLLVDDEPRVLASLQEMLKGSGYAITTADSGTAALACLVEMRFDLVLLFLSLALILLWKHGENIGRLLAGTEPRVGQSAR